MYIYIYIQRTAREPALANRQTSRRHERRKGSFANRSIFLSRTESSSPSTRRAFVTIRLA